MGELDVAPEAHRRQPLPAGRLTFLFTDIEGSTRLFHDLVHDYVVVLDRQRAIIREAIQGAGGVEISTSGDGIFAVFSTADDAAQACAVAQRQLAGEPWSHGRPVRIRMGLHTGEAAPFGGDYVSLVVHQAARVAAAAHGGQVLVSDATASALTRHQSLLLGSFLLRDFPEPEQLHQLVVPGSLARFPAPRSRSAVVSHLPGRASSFVGRDTEIENLCSALASARMVTLVGVGGIGKTRLAVEAAERVAARTEGGAHLVELAPVREAWAIPAAVAAALGLTLPSADDPLEALVATIAGLDALVVLDNCEHLLDPVAELADVLVRRTRLQTLATSRAALRIEGELVMPVEPLPSEDAAALLVARARAAGADLPDDETTRAIARQIAASLDGMPLAIELVAVRLADAPPEVVLQRVTSGQLEPVSRRGGDARQRSLDSTIAWSWDLLSGRGQSAWGRLSVLRNGATPDLAAEVIGFDELEHCADAAVHELIEHSVLSQVSGAPGRYRLLEPLREHARSRLGAVETQQSLAQLRAALARRLPLDGTAVVPLMSAHRDDLIAAVQHRPVDGSSLPLARAAAYSTVFGLLAEEGLELAEAVVLDSGLDVPPPALSRALSGGYRHLGRLASARGVIDRALRAAPEGEDRALLESALGDVEFYAGRPVAAREHHQLALDLLPASASTQRAFVTMRLAEIQLVQGDAAGGFALLDNIQADLGGDHAHCVLLHDLAQALCQLGDHVAVRELAARLREQGDGGNREALLCAHMVEAELAEVTGDVAGGLTATAQLLEAARGETRPLDVVWHSTLRSRALLMAGECGAESVDHLGRALRAALAMTNGPSAQLSTPLAVPAAYWPEPTSSRTALAMAKRWSPAYGMLWTHRDLRRAEQRHSDVEPATAVEQRDVEDLIAALRLNLSSTATQTR